jgi:hypothetical protein
MYKDTARGFTHCWVPLGEEPVHPSGSNPVALQFCAAVFHGGVSRLIWVPPTPGVFPKGENLASKHFVAAMRQLKQWVPGWSPAAPSRKRPLEAVLDHARWHTSKQSKAALEAMGVPVLAGFPAQSWDLKVIENCWGMLKMAMQGRRPRTVGGYMRALQKEWAGLPQASINKLVDSWPERLDGVEERGGAWPSKGSK